MEERIWNVLSEYLHNPYGVAGVMGNLYAESALNPKNLQGYYEKKLGMDDETYTKAVDDGSYADFDKDAAGYGLAQWTYPTRKRALLDYAKSRKTSIGDPEMQIDFLLLELGQFPKVVSVLKNAKSVREASDSFMLDYEKPSTKSENARAARAEYGEMFYKKYQHRQVRVTGNIVNVRAGDDAKYKSVGIVSKGDMFDIVATSDDTGWYAIRRPGEDSVVWISNKMAEIV